MMHYLESVEVDDRTLEQPFRMPVQWVNRPNLDFRGFSGQISGGLVRPGDKVKVLPSAKESTIASIVTQDGNLEEAVAGQSVTLTLEDEIDVSRGDVISTVTHPAEVSDQFEATILWMSDQEMLPGRPYLFKLGASTAAATVNQPKYKININTMEHLAAKTLDLNEVGICTLSLDRAVAYDRYADNREMGGFILIDRMTNNTVGMGFINFALRRAENIHWQALDIDRKANAEQKGQSPAVLWFTGLSGSGKSTIANAVQKKLYARGRHTFLLDGDNVRHGLNRDLGFTDTDRVENIRRVAEVSGLMVDAGLITLVSFISPFAAERQLARERVGDDCFLEIYVATPLEVAEERDPKGLYKKARSGDLKNFTGIDSPYEPPENPDITLDTVALDVEAAADVVIAALEDRGFIS